MSDQLSFKECAEWAIANAEHPGEAGMIAATLYLAEQQRIGNKLLVAQIDQLTVIAQMIPMPGYPIDPSIRIRDYLTEPEWESLGEGLGGAE